MSDLFTEAFDQIGELFEELMPTVPLTVRDIDPDTGATVTEVENVPGLIRPRKRLQPGEVPTDRARWVIRYENLGFDPKKVDELEEADGTVWHVESADLIAFRQLAALECVKKR